MSTTEENIVRLAVICKGDKKQMAALSGLAKSLKLKTPANRKRHQSAQAQRLSNFVGIHKPDLYSLIATYGTTRIANVLGAQSILETAAIKFAAMQKGKK